MARRNPVPPVFADEPDGSLFENDEGTWKKDGDELVFVEADDADTKREGTPTRFEFSLPEIKLELPPFPDTTPQLERIAKALQRGDVANAVVQLGDKLTALENAVRDAPAGGADLESIVRAIDRNTDALTALADAMMAPKHIIYADDAKTIPIGTRVGKTH
jgi:hypothetical protein